MGKSRRVLHHKDDAKDGEINKLKKAIRRLESDKRKLLSELKTLEEAFHHNVKFLKGKVDNLSVSELIEAAKKQMSLKEIEEEKEQKLEDLEKKSKCNKKGCAGVMKPWIYPTIEGRFYIIKCSNPKCTNRTKPQPYHDKVEGVK